MAAWLTSGNVVGDTGDSATDTRVGAIDIGLVQANLTAFSLEAIDNPYDFNRDQRVGAIDIGLLQANLSGFSTTPLITAPLPAVSSSVNVVGIVDAQEAAVEAAVEIAAVEALEFVSSESTIIGVSESSLFPQTNSVLAIPAVSASQIASTGFTSSDLDASFEIDSSDELALQGSSVLEDLDTASELTTVANADTGASPLALDEFFEGSFSADFAAEI